MKRRVVIGIGNPGEEYEGTRHNIGFAVCDELVARGKEKFTKAPYAGKVAQVQIKNAVLELVKPWTYVNLTGQILPFLDLQDPRHLMVVLDDADLPLGKIRIKPKGSSGGHKGLQSIIDQLGEEEFPRLRIGIGRRPGSALREHVLRVFDVQEVPLVRRVTSHSADAVTVWALSGIDACMNRFNRKSIDEEE